MFGNAEDRLQNDAQTVVNFLSDGAVVDAIMSIERKPSRPDEDDEEDSHIRKIDVTNPQSNFSNTLFSKNNLFHNDPLQRRFSNLL